MQTPNDNFDIKYADIIKLLNENKTINEIEQIGYANGTIRFVKWVLLKRDKQPKQQTQHPIESATLNDMHTSQLIKLQTELLDTLNDIEDKKFVTVCRISTILRRRLL